MLAKLLLFIYAVINAVWLLTSLINDTYLSVVLQYDGCDLTKKPLYRYAGCHRYDVSAFNVLLGKMFYFDDRTYIPSEVPFYREKVLPPMYKTSLPSLQRTTNRSKIVSSLWQVEQKNDNRQPIVFRRKE